METCRKRPKRPLDLTELRMARLAMQHVAGNDQRHLLKEIALKTIRIIFSDEPFEQKKYGPLKLVVHMVKRRLDEEEQTGVHALLIKWYEQEHRTHLWKRLNIRRARLPPDLETHVIATIGTIILAHRVTYNPTCVFLKPFYDPYEEEEDQRNRAND